MALSSVYIGNSVIDSNLVGDIFCKSNCCCHLALQAGYGKCCLAKVCNVDFRCLHSDQAKDCIRACHNATAVASSSQSSWSQACKIGF